ncbi:MAG TPA: transposase, partial [Alicyclobacillus sp.]|nr:transposase [Alicyclobacillus sp.]
WERVYRCEECGAVMDRDENAARNLAALAAAVAGSGPETKNARREDVRPGPAGRSSMKREAGTGQPGKTGAPAPQGTGT